MTDGFVFRAYNNVPILIDRYPDNSRLRTLAIDAVRHPNRPRLKAFTSIHHEWLKHLAPTSIAMLGGQYETEELERTIKEIMERHKETLDRLAEDD